jgi:hypothetical protein
MPATQSEKLKISGKNGRQANVLLCVLATILIVSMIGGAILLNCVNRFNVSCTQVRGWKEALSAAEAGGDIAYAEIRKTISNPSQAWSGWTSSGGVYTSSVATFGSHNLTTSSRVDNFYTDPTGNAWYRIRVKGTAPALGLGRAGMDDRMSVGTKGDSLLRKIDFKFDHFFATYGPNGDNVGKTLVSVSQPQITRRTELIAAPVTPFEAAVKCTTAFLAPGSAGVIDSYNSKNGSYYFCANNPADSHYNDSRSGSVAVATPNFNTFNGTIYGNVSTNGGTVTPSPKIQGSIDNNVPFTVPPYKLPTDLPAPQPSPINVNSNVTINPPSAGTAANPTAYLLTSIDKTLTINQVGSAQTYVAIHVTGDITGKITVPNGVHVKIFFDGNVDVKARDIDNQSGLAANLQFYGISPTDPTVTQQIDIGPPGDFAATFYAPSADYHMNGNPDITGAIVCKTFYGNGNTSWHYDRALDTEGEVVDYRVASYVEDTR